jgi:hypothetical protein
MVSINAYALVIKTQLFYYMRQLRNVNKHIKELLISTSMLSNAGGGIDYYDQRSQQLQRQHSEIIDKIKKLKLKLNEL